MYHMLLTAGFGLYDFSNGFVVFMYLAYLRHICKHFGVKQDVVCTWPLVRARTARTYDSQACTDAHLFSLRICLLLVVLRSGRFGAIGARQARIGHDNKGTGAIHALRVECRERSLWEDGNDHKRRTWTIAQ